MEFTRAQEKALIKLGVKALLDSLVSEPKAKKIKKEKKQGRKWSPEQRKKFISSMKKKWEEKKDKK